MDDFKNERVNGTRVDFYEIPTGVGEAAEKFSMKDQQKDLLGGSSNQARNKERMGTQADEQQRSITGRELPTNWPRIASPQEKTEGYKALRDEGEDLSKPPKHEHIDRLSYTLKNGNKELRYLAVNHVFGPESRTHPQFAALKENFDQQKPQVVLYEGPKIHEDYKINEEESYRYGEKAFMQYLVQEHNKNLKPGEQPVKMIAADITNEYEPEEYRKRGYSNEEIAENEVLRGAGYESNNIKNSPTFNEEQKRQKILELQQRYLSDPITFISNPNILSLAPRSDGQQWTPELMKVEIERLTGRPLQVDFNQLEVLLFQQMFNDQREFRDRHIIKKVVEACQQYDRVMVIIGSGHSIRERQALEQFFDTNVSMSENGRGDTDVRETRSQNVQSGIESDRQPVGLSEQNPPSPGHDDTAKHALKNYEREQAERDRQGIEAARQEIRDIPGATMDVVKEYHAPAGKEITKVNTYTPIVEQSKK